MHSRIFVIETDVENTFDSDEIFEMIHAENNADYVDEIVDQDRCMDSITNYFSVFDAKAVKTENRFDVSFSVSKVSKWFSEKAKKIRELAEVMENHPEHAASFLPWQIENETNDRYDAYLYLPTHGWLSTWTSAMWSLMREAAANGQEEICLYISQVFDYHF